VSAARGEEALLATRSEFPTLETTLHFISHSLGAMPRGVAGALAEYADAWKRRSIRAWEEGWMALPTAVGDTVARILNAEPGSVSMHENVTVAQALAFSALDFRPPRNRLVCIDEDFPSLLYLYEGLQRRGAEIVRVSARDGRGIDEADVVAAIDERTAVVAISHVLFRTSQLLDLTPIARRAREAGALTMIDVYQSVGAVPLDVIAAGLDMVTGGSVKWLCGGPGAAYLYVRPALARRLEPAITGWLAHETPFTFDTGPVRRHAGERRFWTGTPAIPAFAAARPGYEIVAGLGAEAIRAKSLRQTQRMIEFADDCGMRLVSPREPSRRGGTVVVDVPRAAEVCRALNADDVLLDFRQDVGLRLAPHFYTLDDEVDRVMARVRDEARAAVT
jgi:kynureninase